jgi:hypothetical protein
MSTSVTATYPFGLSAGVAVGVGIQFMSTRLPSVCGLAGYFRLVALDAGPVTFGIVLSDPENGYVGWVFSASIGNSARLGYYLTYTKILQSYGSGCECKQ